MTKHLLLASSLALSLGFALACSGLTDKGGEPPPPPPPLDDEGTDEAPPPDGPDVGTTTSGDPSDAKEEPEEVTYEYYNITADLEITASHKDRIEDEAERIAMDQARQLGYTNVKNVRVMRKKCNDTVCKAVVSAKAYRKKKVEAPTEDKE